jgi:hypothetical protein
MKPAVAVALIAALVMTPALAVAAPASATNWKPLYVHHPARGTPKFDWPGCLAIARRNSSSEEQAKAVCLDLKFNP